MPDGRAREGARTGTGSVSVARTGTRTYLGRTERGDEIAIGPVGTPGHVSPGELLKLALAGCAAMSADRVLARRVGDDADVTVWAHGTSDPEHDRYEAVDEEFVLDGVDLDDEDRRRLATIVGRAVAAGCTVARSVDGCIELTTTVDGQPVHGRPG